jgi:hypothetical protein
MTTPADFYGVPLVGITQQTDVITLTASPSALSKKGIVSYPSQETAGATPTADVIAVYDVTASKALALGTDYTLSASGAAPETQTYSVTWASSSPNASSGDTCRVSYRYGTIPDTSHNAGDFEGEAGAAPAGTASQASVQATTGSVTAGIGDQAAGGSLTDPAAGTQSSSETGSPGSEYKVAEVAPGTFGWPPGSPDTEAVYGGPLPENFTPAATTYSGTLDTTVAGGSNLVPGMYSSPPGYRAPSAGVAAAVKDTTLTDILGNEVNDNPVFTDSSYAAHQIDTSYTGAPAAPTPLAVQADAFAADQAGSPDYLGQQGVVPSTIVVTNTSTSTLMVLTTDYTVTTAGNGPTLTAYVTPVAGVNFANGNNISVAYSYGDATYWDSNPPASVPGAPALNSVTAVNRGAKVNWSAPSTNVYIQYYLVQASDLGTMYVPYTGQPVEYGQPAPSGGATYGQPTFQSDALTLVTAALAAPVAPAPTTATTGGTVLAGTYHAITTYVNANGETVGSTSGSVTTTGTTSTVTVPSPAAETGATGWYAYVTQAGGSVYTRQQAAGSPTAIGTGLTLTAPPTSSGANPPALNTTIPTLSQSGILTPPGQLIVRDTTSSAQSILASGEIAGGEADPLQSGGQVLEYGYDYTVTVLGAGPWTQYQVALAAGSVNAKAGDAITVDYWFGSDPSSVAAVFTQGLVQNTPVIYRPDGTTPYSQGYRFKVAAGNQLGLGPFSAWSSYVVPLNYNEAQPGSEGSINVGTGSLDPANAINPVYRPDGTVKSGTGLGG